VLYANAGGGAMLPLGQITEEHFDDIFGRLQDDETGSSAPA
jgi:hypothetical protein